MSGFGAAGAEQWADEVRVLFVHFTITVGIHPPAPADIVVIPGAPLGHRSTMGPASLQFLERAIWRYGSGGNDRVVLGLSGIIDISG